MGGLPSVILPPAHLPRPGPQVASILLPSAFVYDVWWVFIQVSAAVLRLWAARWALLGAVGAQAAQWRGHPLR